MSGAPVPGSTVCLPMSDGEVSVPAAWLERGAPPLEVDFGCHRGAFLVGMATLHPAGNFLGIERQALRVAKCCSKITRLGLSNAWAVQGEGPDPLRRLLPDGSVSVFHVSFPDPWPKRRHAARRLVNAEFLEEVRRVLRPDGVLRLMTDDEPYFREMEELTAAGWSVVSWDDGREVVPTAFEITFRQMGKSPFRRALTPQGPVPAQHPSAGDVRPARELGNFPDSEIP